MNITIQDLPYELYNLEVDSEEIDNLYDKHPEIVEKLVLRITEIIENGRSTPGIPQNYVKENCDQVIWMQTKKSKQ